jgi:hypothetical protein
VTHEISTNVQFFFSFPLRSHASANAGNLSPTTREIQNHATSRTNATTTTTTPRTGAMAQEDIAPTQTYSRHPRTMHATHAQCAPAPRTRAPTQRGEQVTPTTKHVEGRETSTPFQRTGIHKAWME